ncbi:MAG: hypothetical protein U0894_04205 [Pirellulales bacterium]
MKTKGLVRAAVFAIASALGSFCGASEAISFDTTEQMIASEAEPSLMDYVTNDGLSGGRWYAGSEMTMLNVKATTGGIISMSFSDTTAPGVATASVRNTGIDNLTYSPRFWIGREINDCWAVQTRFWQLNSTKLEPSPANPAIPNTGSNFATIDDLDSVKFYTLDVEAVRRFTPGAWKVDGTFGARHASFDSNAASTAFGVFTTGNFINVRLSNGSSFDGTGVTSAVLGRRALGDSCVSLFVGGRGSHMWGRTDSFARSVGTVASSPSAPLVGAATVTRANAEGTMDIIEMQIGLQWDLEMRCIPANAFFRAGFEGQYWKLTGRPTGGAGFGGTIGEITTNSFASADLGEARLVGGVLGVGLNW